MNSIVALSHHPARRSSAGLRGRRPITGAVVAVEAVTSTIQRVTISVQANLRPALRRPHHATVELQTAKGALHRVLTPAPFREETHSRKLLTEFDVVTHSGPGEITPWVRRLRTGDELRMTLSSEHLDLPVGFARYILLADATGLPALRALLGHLPRTAEVFAYASAYYSDTPRYLGHQPCLEWLPATSTDAELADALSSHGPLSDDVFVWAAGAEHRMRLLRPLVERGPRSPSVSSITDYWCRSIPSLNAAHAS